MRKPAVERCDVLIVGAGPAGSSCAFGLRGSGLDVLVLDGKPFPRNKVCAGWVTPQVLEAVGLSATDYALQGTIEPIHGFRISLVDGPDSEVDFGETVSYAVRRSEFDEYLLSKSNARKILGEPVGRIERGNGRWIVNGRIEAKALVGAGGHFCPVARLLGKGQRRAERALVAREVEFEMDEEQQRRCPVRAELPELFFCRDLKGYGWVVRKGRFLNVGLGREDSRGFPLRVEEFVLWLERQGRVPPRLPDGLKGHAYLLYGQSPRPAGDVGALLVGDAMGMAYDPSGEGIRPAVESGLIAADILAETGGEIDPATVRRYQAAIEGRFGPRRGLARFRPSHLLPETVRSRVASFLLGSPWFARRVVEGWFLRREDPPLRWRARSEGARARRPDPCRQ